MNKQKEQELEQTLSKFIDTFLYKLDCDGSTRLVAMLLQNKKIDFKIYTGAIQHKNNHFPLHYWIETSNGVIFDFKSKKWIGVDSKETTYLNKELVDTQEFLSVGGNKYTVMGVLLCIGSEE